MTLTWTGLARLTLVATLPLLFLPALPGRTLLIVMAAVGLLLIHRDTVYLRLCGYGLLLLVWALIEARQVTGHINWLVAQSHDALVRVEEVQRERQRIKVKLLRIDGHYQYPPLYAWLALPAETEHYCPGQRWQMQLRLRAVHARLNEGGFDAQRFALANHTPFQGRILSRQALDRRCSWRDRIIQHHQNALQRLPMQGILRALAFGHRDALSDEVRQLLRETGTAHLMAISGMHIALAASVGWLLLRGLQRGLPERAIDYRAPLLSSLMTAALYTWLSGAQAPAQRAMLALTLWSGLRLAGLHLTGWHVWTLCIGLMLFLDPLTVLSESFWLSVLAVGMLLLWYHWFPLPAKFARRRWLPLQLMHLQLGILLLMTPLQAALFNGISLTALVANLLAIPVISCVTVPLLLLAMLLPVAPLHTLLWWLADRSLALVIYGLTALPPGWWPVREAGLYGAVIWGGMIIWRFGWWQSAPVSCCSLMLSLLLWRYSAEKVEWRIDMLDVGHGLAVIISQEDEAVIYDTGNRWAHGNAGEHIIVPWLQHKGINVSQVILSHKHLDHTGGLTGIKQAWPALTVRSALAQPGHLPCYRGTRWQWGRLTFQVLWPEANVTAGNNNDSCVVKVSDGRVTMLLTGDLEQDAEHKLVMLEKAGVQADILQVPHHGSRTSSTPLLLRQVAGRAALASVARYNAWRMPARQVVRNYAKNGYIWFDTAQSGQLSIKIYQGKWQVAGFREQIMPRWYHQWFGVKRDSR
ncbi:DNA internalization-related competence protein ComEC/Rec2 [[Erwinia] mediterraneensis]|uniref:DNA internalization-related competence protein ComEC/Rec2 n=1 Tax=[Erwinia] mediterraneensis TaxID=2161819 RepID=UPI001030D9BA|nr:DNA internalization-related competence protein ComEC/Rec2 [[Erwinia] mediterraneensis]